MFAPVVTIAAIGDSHEGLLLRALLERMGQQVLLVPLEAPEDLIAFLSQDTALTQTAIIAGPGDGNGFIFGASGYARTDDLMVDDSVGPGCLRGRVKLSGQLIVSTARASGQVAIAQSLLDGGAGAYLAPEGWPSPAQVALFTHVFLHEHLLRGADVETAMVNAHGYADAFTLYMA